MMKKPDALDKATHMFFAIDSDGGVYASAWDVPEWKTAKEFYKDHAGNTIVRSLHGSDECNDLFERMKLYTSKKTARKQ